MDAVRGLQVRLKDAARDGDEAALREVLAAGADVNGAAPGDDSALCFAAMSGHPGCTRLLVEAGADVNHGGSYGRTPLHYAATRDLAVTAYLLDHGADMRARNDGDEDALEDLITHDNAQVEIARLLVARGFDLGMRATRYHAGRPHLTWAAYCGRVAIVALLIESGADVNDGGAWTFSDLCASCRPQGRHAILRLLVKGGLDPNTRASYHGTVLMVAARFGDLELVRELLERGADPNLGESGATPLSCAAEGRNPRVERLLRKHGARARSDARATAAKDRRLTAARRRASGAPEDAGARLAHARELARLGFRAAAWHEALAAERRGASIPGELRASFSYENPPGTLWLLLPLPEEGVAGPVEDGRFPGARVASGERQLPLAIVLCRPCTSCDADGTTVCSQCSGSGTRYGFFNDDHEYPCDPRQTCCGCGGTKFVLNTSRAAVGSCSHGQRRKEAEGAGYTLSRCTACGLPSVSCGGMWVNLTACSECNLFDCTCPR